MVKIEISNKMFFVIILLGAVLIATGISYAYGTSNPVVIGHTASEVNIDTGSGVYDNLQNLYNTGALGGGAETDPTVQANVKDGVDWSELSGVPAGFVDGVDNEGGGGGEGTVIWFGNVSARMKDGAYISKNCYYDSSSSSNLDRRVFAESKIEGGKIYVRVRYFYRSGCASFTPSCFPTLICDSTWVEGRETSCTYWYDGTLATVKVYESGIRAKFVHGSSTSGACNDFGGIWE